MNVNEVVNVYLGFRANQPVAAAADSTMAQCSILPSFLVDAFSAAQLDPSRPDEEAAVMLKHRNELLAHFSSQK